MTIYRWDSGSAVSLVETHHHHNQWEVTIHVAKDTPRDSMASLPQAFSQQGWFAVPDTTKEGESVLKLYGFNDPRGVLRTLTQKSWVQGTPTEEQTSEEKTATRDKIKTSGWIYIVGDTLNIAAGLVAQNTKVVRGSVKNFLSSGLLIYGRTITPDNPLGMFVRKATKSLQRHGIDVSSYDSADRLAETPGFKEGIDRFLSGYSVETLLAINTWGSYDYVRGGLGKLGAGGQSAGGITDTVLKSHDMGRLGQGIAGVITGVNALITRVLMENRHRMDPDGTLRHITDAMEKIAVPMRAIGNACGNIMNIGFSGYYAAEGWRKGGATDPKFLKSVLGGTASLIHLSANFFYGRGKQKKQDPFSMEDAAAALANIIHTLPEAQRVSAVKEASRYLATQDHGKASVSGYAALLRGKIAGLDHSPFIEHSSRDLQAQAFSGAISR